MGREANGGTGSKRNKREIRNGKVRGKGLEWARRECMDRERWRSVCCGHPPGGRFWWE